MLKIFWTGCYKAPCYFFIYKQRGKEYSSNWKILPKLRKKGDYYELL
nr:MAG TPA: hypothetical protein [Caudoviricetes sp.]